MRYEETRPGGALAPFVECMWMAVDEDAGTLEAPPERILPDGCVEWIFHLGAPYRRWREGRPAEAQPSSFIVGPATRPLFVVPGGPVATMGVRFRPGGASAFLPVALDELADTAAATGDLWGADGRRIEDAAFHADSAASRRQILEEFLLGRLDAALDPRLAQTVGRVLHGRGRTRVAELARISLWSPRQLERAFRQRVGLPPKTLARIARFQNVLRLSGRHPGRSWADVAADVGYADQAHLIREFREFSGTTPAERRAADGDLAPHFSEPRRLETLLTPR